MYSTVEGLKKTNILGLLSRNFNKSCSKVLLGKVLYAIILWTFMSFSLRVFSIVSLPISLQGYNKGFDFFAIDATNNSANSLELPVWLPKQFSEPKWLLANDSVAVPTQYTGKDFQGSRTLSSLETRPIASAARRLVSISPINITLNKDNTDL